MKRLVFALALLLAAVAVSAKLKVKQKSFEPVVPADAYAIAGQYVGIEHGFEITLSVDATGKVSGVLLRDGVAKPLRDLVIDGAELRSNLLGGTFGNRVLNGDRRYGLLLSWPVVQLDGQSLEHLFCRKLSPRA